LKILHFALAFFPEYSGTTIRLSTLLFHLPYEILLVVPDRTIGGDVIEQREEYFNNIKVKQPENDTNLDNVEIIAGFVIKNAIDEIDTIQISYIVKNGLYRVTSGICFNDAYKISFKGLTEKANTIIIELFKQTKDVVVIKSTIFRYIIFLWAGAILILFGLLLILIKKELKAF